ncbi:YbgC/FadM family acyl-CoA thioesterase [Agaribacterium sp. ZY112]|uniref:YbgC/FadM family acyl-CoA thioesterase n=1 Tax=Agaribacterium sp. ZY112 TaxID=3233574 RepID=UPI003523A602
MQVKEFSSPMRVYIEDTDAGGVVYYVNYLKFMERARTELFRSIGVDKPALLTDELCLVISSASVDYKCSARLDDLLNVSAVPVKLGRSFVVFEQQVTRDNESGSLVELLAKGAVKVVCVKRSTFKPSPFPVDVWRALKDLTEF